jgi:acetylornithine deacetylase
METFEEIQRRFTMFFLHIPKKRLYQLATPSTMKPTQWSCFPGECTISKNVRLIPFCNCFDVVKKLKEYMDKIDANIENLKTKGQEHRSRGSQMLR